MDDFVPVSSVLRVKLSLFHIENHLMTDSLLLESFKQLLLKSQEA